MESVWWAQRYGWLGAWRTMLGGGRLPWARRWWVGRSCLYKDHGSWLLIQACIWESEMSTGEGDLRVAGTWWVSLSDSGEWAESCPV